MDSNQVGFLLIFCMRIYIFKRTYLTLFSLSILISCGGGDRKSSGKKRGCTLTEREIAEDTVDQKLFKSVEARKAKRRKERRRKNLGNEPAMSLEKRRNTNEKTKTMGTKAAGSDLDEDDQEEQESQSQCENKPTAGTPRRKKKTASKKQQQSQIQSDFKTTEKEESGAASGVSTPVAQSPKPKTPVARTPRAPERINGLKTTEEDGYIRLADLK